jgi:hypothetical protein
MTDEQINERFHELVIKHATGTATPHEIAKLDRYQALRRRRYWSRPSKRNRRVDMLIKYGMKLTKRLFAHPGRQDKPETLRIFNLLK